MFAVKNCRYLFQGKRVLFNGKRTMNGANAITSAQCWISGKMRVNIQSSYQFGNLSYAIYYFVGNFKRRLFVSHRNTPW